MEVVSTHKCYGAERGDRSNQKLFSLSLFRTEHQHGLAVFGPLDCSALLERPNPSKLEGVFKTANGINQVTFKQAGQMVSDHARLLYRVVPSPRVSSCEWCTLKMIYKWREACARLH